MKRQLVRHHVMKSVRWVLDLVGQVDRVGQVNEKQ